MLYIGGYLTSNEKDEWDVKGNKNEIDIVAMNEYEKRIDFSRGSSR